MKLLLENWQKYLKENYVLVGNCKDFDEDGYCMIGELPYSDVTNFAQAEESASEISAEEFHSAVGDVIEVAEPIYLYDSKYDVYMLYDDAEDVHYFYVRIF